MFDKFNSDPSLDYYAAMSSLVRFFQVDGLRFGWSRIVQETAPNYDAFDASEDFERLQELIGQQAANTALLELAADPTTAKLAKHAGFLGSIVWPDTTQPPDIEKLKIAALKLLEQIEPEQIVSSLSIFRRNIFPLDPELLFPFTKHENERVVRHTWIALKQMTHPAVRQFALDNLRSDNPYWYARNLLIANYQPGDWALLESITERASEDSVDDRWRLGFTVQEMFNTHPSQEAEGTLLNMYEIDPAGHFREKFVRDLHSLGKLPDWMRDECRYDSYSGTREFIAELDRTEPKAVL